MSLGRLEMSAPAADGLILNGTLKHPAKYAGAFQLVLLAHHYPATRDSYAPFVADLLDDGIATLAFDLRGHDAPARIRSVVEQQILVYLASSREDSFEGATNVTAWGRGLPHVTSRIVSGSAPAMAIYYHVRDERHRFLQQSLQPQ